MTPRPLWRQLLATCREPLGILVIATLVRFVFILSMGNRYYFADTGEYETQALQILHGGGIFSASPRAPLFPAMMALGMLVGGTHNYTAVRMLQLLVSVGRVLLIGRIARRMAGPVVQRLAMLGVALSPTLVFSTGMLYPTTLYSCFPLLATDLALSLDERPRAWQGLAIGLCAVLAWLTDPVAVAPFAALFAWVAFAPGPRRQRIPALALALLVIVIGVVPYARAREARFPGQNVFMSKPQWIMHWARTESDFSAERHVREPADSTWHPLALRPFLDRETRLMREQPLAYLHDYTFEFVHFFKPYPDRITTQNRYNTPLVLVTGAIWFVPVLGLALLALRSRRVRRRDLLLLWGVVLATDLLYSVFFTQTRYRIPVEPQLVILAAMGLHWAFPRLTERLMGVPTTTA